MHDIIIPKKRENSSLSLTEQLREQYQETFDLIINHEWMIDLLNNNLSLEQFESFIAQEAHLYDLLARKVLKLALKHTSDHYDDLMRIGIFLYSESYENLRPMDDDYPLSCSTKGYCEELERVWDNDAPYTHKLLSLLSLLWIREGLYHLLMSEPTYATHFKVWTERVVNKSSRDVVSSLTRLLNQSFEEAYGKDEKALFYQDGVRELESLLSTLTQFELLIRNHAYHSYPNNQGE